MMGEEVFQLHVATPTYATNTMPLDKARQEISLTMVFFAGSQKGLHSMLVPTRSSFPAGVQQGLLYLLMTNYAMATKQNGHWS